MRARIFESTSRTIRRAGFDGVTVVNIMVSIGRTHGGIYEYFPTRDHLLVEACVAASVSGNVATSARPESLCGTSPSAIAAYVAADLHRERALNRENGYAIATLISQIPQQSAGIQHAGVTRSRALTSLVLSFLPALTPASQTSWIASQRGRASDGANGWRCCARHRAHELHTDIHPDLPCGLLGPIRRPVADALAFDSA